MELLATSSTEFAQILTPDALQFIEKLEREFGSRRRELLEERVKRQAMADMGYKFQFITLADFTR